jgi:hypothetical protein
MVVRFDGFHVFTFHVFTFHVFDADDFSALVFADVWLLKQRGAQVDSRAVDRAIERVKRRQKLASALVAEPVSGSTTISVPEIVQQRELRGAMSRFLGTLNPGEALLFEQCIMNGKPLPEFITETRIPRATFIEPMMLFGIGSSRHFTGRKRKEQFIKCLGAKVLGLDDRYPSANGLPALTN